MPLLTPHLSSHMKTSLSNSIGHQLSSEELHRRQQEQHMERIAPAVVVAGVADPINIGTIFRICDAVKCKQIVFVDVGGIDIQKVKRASRSTNAVVPFEFVSVRAKSASCKLRSEGIIKLDWSSLLL
jgi:tRNA G18 (ribose-2'-O)-methylase SpoU